MQGFPNSVKTCGGIGNFAKGVDYFTLLFGEGLTIGGDEGQGEWANF